MKKALTLVFLIGTLAFAIAQSVPYNATFTWTPNPPQELVSSYRIEYQKLPAVTNWTYITSVSSSTNSVTIKNLQPGYVYQFRAFAVNGIGTGTNQSSVIQIPSTLPSGVTNFSN
jgi:hypothetical protein